MNQLALYLYIEPTAIIMYLNILFYLYLLLIIENTQIKKFIHDTFHVRHIIVYGAPLQLFPSPNELAKPTSDVPAVSDYIQCIQDNIAFARDRYAELKTK